MRPHERTLQYFLFGQDFADGLRITLSIALPALVLAQFGQLETGLGISVGAVCASIPDIPGPQTHKRNGMLVAIGLGLLVVLLTAFARRHDWLMGLEVALLSFLFSMLSVYGARAAAVGTAALLIMILTMDRPLTTAQVLPYAALTVGGGLWYLLVAMAFSLLQPYRAAQRALGDCIHHVARFLRLKAAFYVPTTDLEQDYNALLAQQVVVNEKMEGVRELLFKTRQIVRESTGTSRTLLLTFVDVVDLYEHITAIYYDYAELRQRFGPSGLLTDVADVIRQMAAELDHIGLAVQANRAYTSPARLPAALEHLKARIDALGRQPDAPNTLVLKKLLVNLRTLNQGLTDMLVYLDPRHTVPARRTGEIEYTRFVSRQSFDLQVLRDNLTLSSISFRHAVRMAVACVVGFVVAKMLDYGHHDYWIVMTITYMIKPGFSLTKERNIQRLQGTLAGGILGLLVLLLVRPAPALVAAMVVFMVTAFSFQRRYYVVTVLFTTAFLLIAFHFLGLAARGVIEERVLDTTIGCAIALGAGYVLFPRWESEQLRGYMRDVLRANRHYLRQLADGLAGRRPAATDYRLARKDVYLSSANLAAAFQRMLSEPKSTQRHPRAIHQFVVLNHILSSNIATVAAATAPDAPTTAPVENLRPVRHALTLLTDSLHRLDPATSETDPLPLPPAGIHSTTAPTAPASSSDERQLLEQLEFIQKVSGDIRRVTDDVLR